MKTLLFFFLAGQLILQGCAHGPVQKQLDEKLAREPESIKQRDLQLEGEKLLNAAVGLSEKQKSDIRSLWARTRTQTDQKLQESVKLRSVLIKDIVSPNYNPNEVDLIKKKLSDVEHDRLSIYFSAVRETNRILGRWGSAGERSRYLELMETSDPMFWRF